MRAMSAETKLPLFVFPTSLSFYADDTSSHQQVLTLYNPYNFSLKYKVLSTAPKKYRVMDADGTIKPRCCIDIYIRHRDVCVNNEHVQDKFRLQVSEHGQKNILGRRDILSVLLPTTDSAQQSELNNADEQFQSLPVAASAVTATSSSLLAVSAAQQSSTNIHLQALPHRPTVPTGVASPSWVVLVTVVLCILVLMLPLDSATSMTDNSSYIHQYVVVSIHQKLIAAYVLGLVTMVILRS